MVLAPSARDESFEPTEPTELALSVFGYLDASADTQWIRVMPIRALKVTSPDPLAATVTLEHLETGQIIQLEDSLFNFSSSSDPALGSDGAYIHNFWTTEPIEPGASYRLVATRKGKEPAESVVEIPADYEVEVAIKVGGRWWQTDELRITGVKHLPFLSAITHFSDDCGTIPLTAHHLSAQRSAFSVQRSAFSAQRPAPSARRRYSFFRTTESAGTMSSTFHRNSV